MRAVQAKAFALDALIIQHDHVGEIVGLARSDPKSAGRAQLLTAAHLIRHKKLLL